MQVKTYQKNKNKNAKNYKNQPAVRKKYKKMFEKVLTEIEIGYKIRTTKANNDSNK